MTRGRTGKWVKRLRGETTWGEMESGRNDLDSLVLDQQILIVKYYITLIFIGHCTEFWSRISRKYKQYLCHLTLLVYYETKL